MSVHIYPPPGDPVETQRIASILLDAADDPSQVQIETSSRFAFVVPDDVASKANLNTSKPQETEKEESSSKKKSGKKGAS